MMFVEERGRKAIPRSSTRGSSSGGFGRPGAAAGKPQRRNERHATVLHIDDAEAGARPSPTFPVPRAMVTDASRSAGRWTAPLWSSGFRPFFLGGLGYGLVAIAAWFLAYSGVLALAPAGVWLAAWHGHEMVFGFLAGIICGLLLTALPSWAGVPEIAGGRLALLAGAWLAGRAALWLAPLLPPALVAAVDVAALALLAAMLAPDLARARQRRFLVVLPVLGALAALNVAFHVARARADAQAMSHALETAVATIAVLYALVGGLMTPVFTDNALREQDAQLRTLRHPWLEVAALAFVAAFAVAHALKARPSLMAIVAIGAAVLHAIRLACWHGWRVRRAPLVHGMHLGYAWLVVAFALRGLAETGGVPPRAWLHALTVGAVGTMILALLPRVALRHTGRPLRVQPVVIGAGVAMLAAAVLRVASDNGGALAAAVLWSVATAVCLVVYGPMLARPSLPRAPGA
jgi:uncharacterized protein involved in response to NO